MIDGAAPDLTPSNEGLDGLGRWTEELASPDLAFGGWVRSTTRPDGVMTMPYVELGPDAMRFLRDLGSLGLVVPYDWQTWMASPEGAAYRDDRSRIAQAPPEDLVRMLTAIVRADRFNEGELLDAFETGLLLAIARRARDLASPPTA